MTTNKNVKNVKNIYLCLLNKYKSNEKNFEKQIKIISQMKSDADWDKLSAEEKLKIQSEIFM